MQPELRISATRCKYILLQTKQFFKWYFVQKFRLRDDGKGYIFTVSSVLFAVFRCVLAPVSDE